MLEFTIDGYPSTKSNASSFSNVFLWERKSVHLICCVAMYVFVLWNALCVVNNIFAICSVSKLVTPWLLYVSHLLLLKLSASLYCSFVFTISPSLHSSWSTSRFPLEFIFNLWDIVDYIMDDLTGYCLDLGSLIFQGWRWYVCLCRVAVIDAHISDFDSV